MRDFKKTSEPSGTTRHPRASKANPGTSPDKQAPTFVVQKHAATALHYDFRLQVGDVMPSWAVPKGPSYDPKVRRLAVQTEDHPLDYQTFEGIIPAGEYGGGQVIVWDRGTYEHISTKPGKLPDMRQAIEAGHFTVELSGEKLKGAWSLIRTRQQNGKDQWVMVKHKDDYVDTKLDIEKERPESVKTGQTIEDLSEAKPLRKQGPRSKPGAWTAPMLASLAKTSPTGAGWIYERKLDGLRCLAIRHCDEINLWSRNQLSFNARFPKIIEDLRSLPVDDFVLDGEIVAFDSKGNTSFSLLQQGKNTKPQLYIFDVVHLLGQDTVSLPLHQRKKLLTDAIDETETLKVVKEEKGKADALLDKACGKGWEGIVAKKDDSKYTGGRSPNWLKLKCTASQELVIGGWTNPQGARTGFGALLLGYNDATGFRYAGKVGTGFNAEMLDTLSARLEKIERKTSPFIDIVKEKGAHWASPTIVVNISFTEWTNDGRLRHPSFQGLRPDKKANEVVREQ